MSVPAMVTSSSSSPAAGRLSPPLRLASFLRADRPRDDFLKEADPFTPQNILELSHYVPTGTGLSNGDSCEQSSEHLPPSELTF